MSPGPTAGRVAAVFAHPDDDTFALAGSLALHRDDPGLAVCVVLATSGEAGPIADPSLADRENLWQVREKEARAAYAAIGVRPEFHFLRHPDGALARVDREAVVSEVATILLRFRPDVVVTFGPEGVTKHGDHVAAHEIASEAFHRAREAYEPIGFRRLLYASIAAGRIEMFRDLQRQAGQEPFNPEDPFQPRGVPDQTIGVRVNCSSVWKTSVDAIRAHRTQAGEIDAMPEEALPLVFGEETFVVAWPERGPDDPLLSDIFEGLD